MKLASSIQSNSSQVPFAFGCNLLTSSQISCPRNVLLQSVLRRSYFVLSVTQGCACGRKLYYSAIVKAGRTERELETSTSSIEASNSRLSDDSNDEDSSNTAPNTIKGDITGRPADYASSLQTVGICVFSAVAFGAGLGFVEGGGKATEFFAGYLLEQSLSVDNLFVFILIFKYFQVPLEYQSRVLSYGIVGAVIFRLTLIFLGTATIQRFEAVNLFLAAILLYSSFKLFAEQDEDTDLSENFIVKTCQKFIPVTFDYDGNRFFTIQNGVRKATPLLLTVAVIELSDIAFAVDSIPAVFGITRDPSVVFSSNLFAILGLRSYYTLISESMAELEYLQPSIGVVLGFIGCKMILDFFGLHVPTEASLAFVATSLSTGVLLSLMNKSDTK